MKKLLNKDALLVLFISILCVLLLHKKSGFEKPERIANIHRDRATVLSVDNSEVRVNLIIKSGWQMLEAELESGPCKGQIVKVSNQLMGKMELDEHYEPGQDILVQYSIKDGKPVNGLARGHYRLHLQLILLLLFASLLIAIGGWTGFKALISFTFSTLMIWKVMLPLFLKGYDPIPVALCVVAALTASISFLVGGISKKGMTTFLGAFSGLLLTCISAMTFSSGFRINGAVRPFAETLLYSGFSDLKLTPIFIAGIFIAASGAVMDLAMDIASAMEEVKENNPGIGCKDHIWSGIRIGRSVIGTMTTTLLLAYSGSYSTMLMLFIAQGAPVDHLLNLNYVAAEVLNTMVGSFGLLTVAPLTAIIGGFIYRTPVKLKKQA